MVLGAGQWPSSLLLRGLPVPDGPSLVGISYWAWGAADDHGAYPDCMLEAWPVFHRAAGEDGLGSVAAGTIAFMCGFRGFMVPARPT